MKSKRRQRRSKKRIFAALCSVIGSFFLVVVILACIPLTLPRLMGYQVYTVISGSMEPAIATGSLVFVRKEAPEDISVGDVIAFYSATDSGAIITHRVVQNQTVSGEFITKGDDNAKEDMNPVDYDFLIGRVAWSIPFLGMLLEIFTTISGKLTAAGLIVVAVILHTVSGRLRSE